MAVTKDESREKIREKADREYQRVQSVKKLGGTYNPVKREKAEKEYQRVQFTKKLSGTYNPVERERAQMEYRDALVALDNEAIGHRRDAALAQKEYDDYVASPEYRKKLEDIITENFSASETPTSMPQLEDDRAKELKDKAKERKKLSDDEIRKIEERRAALPSPSAVKETPVQFSPVYTPGYERQYNMPEIAADNVVPYLREVTLAQKEYDDYVNSQEFQQRKREAATKLTRNTPMSEVPRNAPQIVEAFEDETSKALKAKADYWKNEQEKAITTRMRQQDMAKVNALPEEDRKLLADYVENKDISENFWAHFGSGGSSLLAATRMDKASQPLVDKYGRDAFDAMVAAYSWDLHERQAEEKMAKAAEDVSTVPGAIGKNIESVGGKLLNVPNAFMGRVGELISPKRYPTLEPVRSNDLASIYYDAVREETGKNIVGEGDNVVRNALGYGYQAAMSTADSLTRLAVLGPTASLGAVAMDSFASGVREATQYGATPAQAYGMGTVNAILEVLTEKVSMDKLLDKAKAGATKDLTKFLLNTIGQAGVEISEEEASLVGSTLAEAAILQEKSEYNRAIQQLVVDGYSYADAKAAAAKAIVDEAKETAIVSGLSGEISGLTATVYSNAVARAEAKTNATQNTQEAVESPQAGISPETSTDTTNAQSPDVEAAGTPQAGNALTNALDKLAETGNVSNKTVEKILADPAAMEQLSRQTGLDLSQMATASEKRNAVKAAVRQMAGDTAPTTLNREGAQSLIEDMGQELAERAPARQETPEATPERQAVQNAFDRVLGVDTGTDGNYNAINENPTQGGTENGTGLQSTDGTGLPGGTGTERVSGTDAGTLPVSGQTPGGMEAGTQVVPGGVQGEPGGGNSQNDLRVSGELRVSDKLQEAQMGKGSPQVADSSGQSTEGGQGGTPAKSSVGAADRDFTGTAAYDDLLSDDNVQPRRASDAKNVEVPKTDTYGRNVSEFAHNAMNSDIISSRDIDTAKRLIQEGAFGHETQKMADVRDRVYDEIQKKGVSASVREVSKAAAGGKISEYDIAKAQALFAMLTDKKGVRAENMAGELLVDLGEMATQSGRQLNMFKLLRKLTPEGQISAVKSNINRYVDTLNEHRSAKKQVNVEIPAELEQAYVKAARSGNEAAQKQALDQMYGYAAAQIPATLEEKFNSLRHLSMLGAPLTHIRNFGATGAFRPMSDIKRTISAGIQAVALDQKNRTAAVLGLGKESRELLSWAKSDAESDMAVSMMKGTYQNGDNARSEIEDKRTIFNNKALEGYRKFNSNALEAEDMVWKKREYALTLASFLKARGYTVDQVTNGVVPSKVMAEGRELAVKEALKSTFNDRNKFSDTISKFRKKGSDPWSRSLDIMAQGILPYTRTPANLGTRSFEYSFAGLTKAAYDLTEGVKSGKITAAQGIDNLASGLTGTGMMFLGGALAAGIIPGVRLVGAKPDDDEDEENTQEYALEIGDLSIGISWLAPVNIPLFVGANLYNKIKAAGDDGDIDPWDIIAAIVDSAASSLDPVLELSCMSGLNDAIDNMKYEDTAGDKFVAMAYSAATGYFLQAIPTLFGRIEKGVEPNKKRTFSNGETTVQRSVERTLGGAFQKLPGDPFQIDKVDAYGNVVKDSGNPVTRLANALLNPFNVQKIDRSELTQEIKRLSGVQPDKVNMPSAPKTVSYTDADGNHHDNERLTAEQYSTLEKTQKQTAAKLLGQVIGTDIYKAMTDDQKADVFSYVYNYAREKGRAEAIDGYPGLSDSWMQDVDKNGYGTIVEKVVTKSFSNAFTSMDTSALENAYGLYSAMDKDRQKQFRENNGGRVGYYITAKEKGVSDGVFTDLYGTYKKLDGDKSMTVNQKAQEWSKTLSEAYEDGRISKAGHDALKEEMAFRQTYTAKTEKFDAMTESGLSSDVADRIIKGLADLQGTGSVDRNTGENKVTDRDKWGYIAALDGLSDKEKDRVMLLYMPDYNPDSGKPDKTELKYAYLRSRGYSAEQFTQTYGVTQEFTTKADMIAAWVALGYSNEEAQMFYKLYKGKLV